VEFLPARDLHFWVNDGLMSIFFLVVGLEIRREMHEGALSDPRSRPFHRCRGRGVVVPALLYVLINTDPAARRGWAIPTATDIALRSASCPSSARRYAGAAHVAADARHHRRHRGHSGDRVLLLERHRGRGLLIVAAGVLGVLLLQWLGCKLRSPMCCRSGGVVRNAACGLHPALAGVLLGLLTPAGSAFGRAQRDPGTRRAVESPVARVEEMLHPWVAFGIMPLFALANAGVSLQGLDLSAAAPLAVGAGIVSGLVLGKPIGIVLASIVAVRLRLCALPRGCAGVTWF